MAYRIEIGRIYDTPDAGGGARVLTDALWPRGMKKADLKADAWYRQASPSAELRGAYHQGKLDFDTFSAGYRRQLSNDPDSLVPLMRYARQGTLWLLTASREPDRSHLPVLRRALLDALAMEDSLYADREPSSPVCYMGREG